MREWETSVSVFDLPPLPKTHFDLQKSNYAFEVREYAKHFSDGDPNEALLYIESTLLGGHGSQQAICKKVKRYYLDLKDSFRETETRFTDIEIGNQAMKSGDSQMWSDAAVEPQRRNNGNLQTSCVTFEAIGRRA